MLFPNIKPRKSGGKDKSARLKTVWCCAAIFLSLVFYSCRKTETVEMRTLLPNNAVAYLETNDLGAMLDALTQSPAFRELAEEKPDFSRLNQMQIAVAVTGFETLEENTVLNFKPQFVAVAETDLWSWQTRSFAENQLDAFVRKNYGADAKRETNRKDGGEFYHWTASDKREVFAFVEGSLIYFGTDRRAIENCLAIKDGAASLMKNESLTAAYTKNNLAFGYVSSEGIKRIADFAGVNIAVETTEESGGRTFIARLLPQLLQNTTKEIIWTANKGERGIEDKFSVSLTPEIIAEAKENLAASEQSSADLTRFLPSDFYSATRYNLRNPAEAWRSSLAVTAKNADALSGKILLEYSDKLLEPYGISSAEKFLNSVDAEIITAEFDQNGGRSVTVVSVKDAATIKKSISEEINFQTKPETINRAEIWFSESKQLAAAFVENALVLGDGESVLECLQAKQNGQSFARNANYQKFIAGKAVAATFAGDADSAEKIVNILAKKKRADQRLATFYLTETVFNENGIERKTVSDFGLLGTIIAQLEK